MPLHFCHPNIPHRKLRMPEWFVSSLMMDRALDAVVRLPPRRDWHKATDRVLDT